MSNNNGVGAPKAVIPLAPKLNGKSQGDELDRAGHAIMDALRQAIGAAEAKHQQAVEKTHQLSAQLRSAEDRIKELETRVWHHESRAERAEDWLYQISVEIEQKFFDGAPATVLRK
jgi:chromosome segregation ATPase